MDLSKDIMSLSCVKITFFFFYARIEINHLYIHIYIHPYLFFFYVNHLSFLSFGLSHSFCLIKQ